MRKNLGPYSGQILRVDLANQKISKGELDKAFIEKFLGSRGINLALLAELLPVGIHPFSERNPLIIGVGPLVGTACPTAGKVCVTTKNAMPADESEVKCVIGAGKAGSRRFGPMLKMAGYDHMVVTGKAETPVYLTVFDDEVEILDASELWGKSIYETEDLLRKKHGGDIGIMSIGRGGENLVKWSYAAIDTTATAGRSGIGAVMGSKMLKAIVVRGTGDVEVAKPEEFLNASRELRRRITKHARFSDFDKYGFMGFWDVWQITLNQGSWPVHKYGSLFDTSKYDRINTTYKACASCPIGCKFRSRIPDGEFEGTETCTVNPSTLPRVGNRLRLENLDEIIALCRSLDEQGVDATTFISMASLIVRMYRSGILTAKEIGFEPDYEIQSMLRLAKLVFEREGIGDILADGFPKVGATFGIDIEEDPEMALAKGVDPIYDARFTGLDPLRFTYITSPRPHHGGAHTILTRPSSVPHGPTTLDMVEKNFEVMGLSDEDFAAIFRPMDNYAGFNVALATIASEDNCVIYDSLGVCSIPPVLGMTDIVAFTELYSLASGFELQTSELRDKAERIFNLHKVLNAREGFDRSDDKVKGWLMPKDTPNGQVKTTDYYRTKIVEEADLNSYLDEYYRRRGWDRRTGLPTKEKLTKLGLEKYQIR